MVAPVILFVYARPDHTAETLMTLKKNTLAPQTDLFIFSDAPKNEKAAPGVAAVRELIRKVNGFKRVEIVERETNWGLAKSIITGVSEVIDAYGKAIVMEDDLVSSPHLLTFMNDALDFYQDQPRIFSISAFNYPKHTMPIPADYTHDVFLSYRNSSWGWATWKDRWKQADWEMKEYDRFLRDRKLRKAFSRGGEDLVDILNAQMEGKVDSWWIRWEYTHFRKDAYAVYPIYSYVNNIGLDGSGTHCEEDQEVFNDLALAPEKVNFPPQLEINEDIIQAYLDIVKYSTSFKIKRAIKKAIRFDELKAVIKKST